MDYNARIDQRGWGPEFALEVNNIFRSGRPEGAGCQCVACESPQVVVRFHDGYTGRLVYAEGISLVDLTSPPRRQDQSRRLMIDDR